MLREDYSHDRRHNGQSRSNDAFGENYFRFLIAVLKGTKRQHHSVVSSSNYLKDVLL
jgi:hypothetical protein